MFVFLSLTPTLSHTTVPLTKQAQLVYALVETDLPDFQSLTGLRQG